MVRFAHHARRVRVLKHIEPTQKKLFVGKRYSSQVLPTIHRACIGVLHEYFQDSTALPALRELTWNHGGVQFARFLAPFFSPALRVLKFENMESRYYTVYDVFDELTKKGCTEALEVLQLDGAGFFDLSEMRGNDLGIELFARLPRLHTLGFFLDLAADYGTVLQRLPPGSFPSLRSLTIHCGTSASRERDLDGDTALGTIAKLLDYLAPTHPLRSLVFEVPRKLKISVSRSAIRAILTAAAAFANTLDTLGFVLGVGLHKGEAPLDRSVFEPLTRVPCVEYIVMEHAAFDIDVANLKAMGDTWPDLCWLCLGQEDVRSPARVPATSLPGLVAEMRSLEKLGVKVYDSGERLDLEMAEKQARRRLRRLDVGHSRFPRERVTEVATYLSRSFPEATLTLSPDIYGINSCVWEKAVEEDKSRQKRNASRVL